jgi:hypothetical protein
MPVWRNWQTRTTQNRVPKGVSVRPRPPVSDDSMPKLSNGRVLIKCEGFFVCFSARYMFGLGAKYLHTLIHKGKLPLEELSLQYIAVGCISDICEGITGCEGQNRLILFDDDGPVILIGDPNLFDDIGI